MTEPDDVTVERIPAPPAPQPPARFVQLDPQVAARVARAAHRRGMVSEDWVNLHFRRYFDEV